VPAVQIKRCPAPCVYSVSQEEYRRSVDESPSSWKASRRLTGSSRAHEGCSQKLEYERAAQLRDQLHAIDRSLEKQRTVLGDLLDQDVLGFYREGQRSRSTCSSSATAASRGRSFGFSRQEFPPRSCSRASSISITSRGLRPKELLLPSTGRRRDARGLAFGEEGSGCASTCGAREKVRLVEMAMENARQSFERRPGRRKKPASSLSASSPAAFAAPSRRMSASTSHLPGQLTSARKCCSPTASRTRAIPLSSAGEAAGDDFASISRCLRVAEARIEEQDCRSPGDRRERPAQRRRRR